MNDILKQIEEDLKMRGFPEQATHKGMTLHVEEIAFLLERAKTVEGLVEQNTNLKKEIKRWQDAHLEDMELRSEDYYS